jgi:hypothetical protein
LVEVLVLIHYEKVPVTQLKLRVVLKCTEKPEWKLCQEGVAKYGPMVLPDPCEAIANLIG